MDTCTGCCDITEIMLKMKLNTIKINQSFNRETYSFGLNFIFYFSLCVSYFQISINNKIKNAVNHDKRGHKNTNNEQRYVKLFHQTTHF